MISTVILLSAALVYATRILGPLLVGTTTVSPRMARFLDTTALSVLVGMVASSLTQTGLREWCAVILAIVVMHVTGSALGALASGIVLAAGWTAFAT